MLALSGLDALPPWVSVCWVASHQALKLCFPAPFLGEGACFILVVFPPQSKRKFERDCREAEKAAQTAERLDQDINATKADVEKVPVGFGTGSGVRVG